MTRILTYTGILREDHGVFASPDKHINMDPILKSAIE